MLIKNFLLILLLVVLPLFGISLGVYNYYGSVYRDEIASAHMNSLSRVRDTIDMIIKEVDKLSVRIASEQSVERFLNNQKDVFPNYESILIIQNVLKGISISASDYIDSIYVYSDINNYILASTKGGISLSSFSDNEWHDTYEEKKQNRVNRWMISRKVTDNITKTVVDYISLFYRAPLSSLNKNGVVIINISIDKIKSLIGEPGKERQEYIYITDQYGDIAYSYDSSLIGKPISEEIGPALALSDGKTHTVRMINGDESVLSYIDSEFNEWKFISVTPLQIYNQKMDALIRFIYLSMVISVIIAIGVAFIISIRVFLPIKNIMLLLEAPEEYMSIRDKNNKRDLNEYKYIASNILRSLDENKYMEQELMDRMKMLKKAQTAALQTQISPHFLYNTLQTINWLVMKLTNSENEASDVVNSLSRILRVTMETENALITIRDEIDYVKQYIEIQKKRYKEIFDVIWDIDPDIMDFLIAKITLQPIIENSIYHGIKPMKIKGYINVRGMNADKSIIIRISDNGVGMLSNKIEKLNNELCTDYIQGDQHIGIKNVNQRIKLIFGSDYGVKINKGYNNGLNVDVVIPKVK